MHTSKSQGACFDKQVCCAYAGLKAAGHAAFVLVAGGLGERLGYSGIKLALPVDSASNMCFLQVGKSQQHFSNFVSHICPHQLLWARGAVLCSLQG